MTRPDYYDVPECETQEKGAPKFCKKSDPGEGAERSCAYDGARVVLMPITDGDPPPATGRSRAPGTRGTTGGRDPAVPSFSRRGFTTEMLGTDVIFGGERKLYKAILDLASRYEGEAKAIFVYATCVTAMTGETTSRRSARRPREKVPIPVIPVPTPGFIGDKNIGNRLAGEVLLKHTRGTVRAGDGYTVRHHPDRRVQHRRRSLGDAPSLREGGDPASCMHLRRRALR